MTRKLFLHLEMTPETLEASKTRWQVQAEYPGSVGDCVARVRHAVASGDYDRAELLDFLDAMSVAAVAAHENFRRLWEFMRSGTLVDPDGRKGEVIQ